MSIGISTFVNEKGIEVPRKQSYSFPFEWLMVINFHVAMSISRNFETIRGTRKARSDLPKLLKTLRMVVAMFLMPLPGQVEVLMKQRWNHASKLLRH